MTSFLIAVCRSSALAFAIAAVVGAGSVYNEEEIRTYADFAQAATCNRDAISTWTCGPSCAKEAIDLSSILLLGPTKVFQQAGFVAALRDDSTGLRRCIAAFRGTSNWESLKLDFDGVKVVWGGTIGTNATWCPGCTVHRGFAEAYEEIRPDLLDALTSLHCESIALTGHSLGGALSTLAALEIRAHLNLPVNPVVTFGSPRIGNVAFAAAFVAASKKQGLEVPEWRVVHFRDAVPRLPSRNHGHPHDPQSAYQHVPQEIYYNEAQNSFQVCDASGEDPNCSNSFSTWQCKLADHGSYLNVTFNNAVSPLCHGHAMLSI